MLPLSVKFDSTKPFSATIEFSIFFYFFPESTLYKKNEMKVLCFTALALQRGKYVSKV